jgi:hypothetical protein
MFVEQEEEEWDDECCVDCSECPKHEECWGEDDSRDCTEGDLY